MNRILTAAALVAMAALTTAPALAATMAAKPAASAMAPAKPTVVSFKTLDANHDGKISFAELKKYWPSLTKAEFDKYADKAGFLNRTELAAFAKAMAPAKTAKTASK